MPIEVNYDELFDCIVLKTYKLVSCGEICAVRDEILNHPRFITNINQIFDSTEGQLELTSEDLIKIASHYNEKAEELGGKRKLALVVSKDLDFGRMRQYEAYFDSGPSVLVHAFRDMAEAKKWLTSSNLR